MKYLLALDQGTTSSRAIVFDEQGHAVSSAQQEFEQIFPSPGHVEHNPEAIWKSQIETAKEALDTNAIPDSEIAAIGIANQRETVVLWDKKSGQPVCNAVVWQSRITDPICKRLKADQLDSFIREKTGLVIDAYFSGTKIQYLLDNISGLRRRAEQGEILFGTVDSFLIWRLTNGRVHATDVTNASRTMLFNIHTQEWDRELLDLLKIPECMLPEVMPSSGIIGHSDPSIFGREIPIAGCAGDQQAATFGQACFSPGDAKNTYGTGCFMLLNTGEQAVTSQLGLLTTIGWKIGKTTTYCLEGSVFIAGAVVQWLRDGIGIIEESAQVTQLCDSVHDNGGVYFVPAFVGLGTPYWDSSARGTIIGITRGTTSGHIARAAIQSMAFQSMDVLDAMQQESGVKLTRLKVDGGATVNNSLLSFQAGLLGVPVLRPQIQETTALGAAFLAGLATGVYADMDEIAEHWTLDREFQPAMSVNQRENLSADWHHAVRAARGWIRD
ncbi:Glycerol kinase [Thalassoglobus neptunius]|uniref:Glycerol kinase n=1 Tax=Thalassoglobus neptunius TaxID=1938619 RepID=A0A5C5X5F3_9PLAN|nr:glycerol kinase GlpK [Thalassoglobus neptunius]TWT57849.1 Glycerol kinase [Thalassoglobus neptunius]